jgi:uncharacterized RDD family membrane protein YckC
MEPQNNPYQPPASEVVLHQHGATELIDASRGQRLGTFVVDYIGFMALSVLVGVALAIVLGERSEQVIQQIPDFLLGLLIYFAYYMFFEAWLARTPGKYVFGTRVVDESGTRASARQIALRTICRFIPFEPFSFFGAKGWHDSIPKTRVVRTRA